MHKCFLKPSAKKLVSSFNQQTIDFMGSGFGISLKKLLNDGYDKTSSDDRDRRPGNKLIIHKS